MSGTEASAGHLRIGELSRRTGVSPDLLRAWERRYGMLSPARTAGGYRLYDEHDVLRVKRMSEHLRAGVAAAQAARMVSSQRQPVRARGAASAPGAANHDSSALRSLANALRASLEHLDDAGAQAALDQLLSAFSLETVLSGAVLPYLSELGERWQAGEPVIGREHFASALLRARLLGLARGWGAGDGPLALLACVPGDQHDLGLICFGLSLRGYGWRIAFLGADTPLASISDAIEMLQPALVMIASSLSGGLDDRAAGLAELARAAPLALAGVGSSHEQAAKVGARHIAQDPMQGAAQVFREGAGRTPARPVTTEETLLA
jgi:MerR family transcriptional regulator, light-induced transcriptional regulator